MAAEDAVRGEERVQTAAHKEDYFYILFIILYLYISYFIFSKKTRPRR